MVIKKGSTQKHTEASPGYGHQEPGDRKSCFIFNQFFPHKSKLPTGKKHLTNLKGLAIRNQKQLTFEQCKDLSLSAAQTHDKRMFGKCTCESKQHVSWMSCQWWSTRLWRVCNAHSNADDMDSNIATVEACAAGRFHLSLHCGQWHNLTPQAQKV